MATLLRCLVEVEDRVQYLPCRWPASLMWRRWQPARVWVPVLGAAVVHVQRIFPGLRRWELPFSMLMWLLVVRRVSRRLVAGWLARGCAMAAFLPHTHCDKVDKSGMFTRSWRSGWSGLGLRCLLLFSVHLLR